MQLIASAEAENALTEEQAQLDALNDELEALTAVPEDERTTEEQHSTVSNSIDLVCSAFRANCKRWFAV